MGYIPFAMLHPEGIAEVHGVNEQQLGDVLPKHPRSSSKTADGRTELMLHLRHHQVTCINYSSWLTCQWHHFHKLFPPTWSSMLLSIHW